MSAATIRRAVALFDPVWDLLLVPERFRILHLLLETVGYDGATGELELMFYPLGITSLAAEAAMIGQTAEVAAWPGTARMPPPGGDTPAEPVTLHFLTHLAAPSFARHPSPHAATWPHSARGPTPRAGVPFEELLDTGAVETQAELAEFAKLTPARVTQIMNLLGVAQTSRRRSSSCHP